MTAFHDVQFSHHTRVENMVGSNCFVDNKISLRPLTTACSFDSRSNSLCSVNKSIARNSRLRNDTNNNGQRNGISASNSFNCRDGPSENLGSLRKKPRARGSRGGGSRRNKRIQQPVASAEIVLSRGDDDSYEKARQENVRPQNNMCNECPNGEVSALLLKEKKQTLREGNAVPAPQPESVLRPKAFLTERKESKKCSVFLSNEEVERTPTASLSDLYSSCSPSISSTSFIEKRDNENDTSGCHSYFDKIDIPTEPGSEDKALPPTASSDVREFIDASQFSVPKSLTSFRFTRGKTLPSVPERAKCNWQNPHSGEETESPVLYKVLPPMPPSEPKPQQWPQNGRPHLLTSAETVEMLSLPHNVRKHANMFIGGGKTLGVPCPNPYALHIKPPLQVNTHQDCGNATSASLDATKTPSKVSSSSKLFNTAGEHISCAATRPDIDRIRKLRQMMSGGGSLFDTSPRSFLMGRVNYK